ncbi:MAG: hypothetical protein AAFY06_11425 [Pseudomonadota bacterium]
MRFIFCLLGVACVGLTGPVLALMTSEPRTGEIMLVIGPDPVAHQAAVRKAGGRVIGPDLARFGVLALAESDAFAAELVAQGAWLVVDGRRVAALCGIKI